MVGALVTASATKPIANEPSVALAGYRVHGNTRATEGDGGCIGVAGFTQGARGHASGVGVTANGTRGTTCHGGVLVLSLVASSAYKPVPVVTWVTSAESGVAGGLNATEFHWSGVVGAICAVGAEGVGSGVGESAGWAGDTRAPLGGVVEAFGTGDT